MNIHPIVVHFPVALLTVYVGLEFLRFRVVLALPWWQYAKALFLIPGSIGAGAALLTGEVAGESFGVGGVFLRILELHELAAQITTAIFAVLAVCYAVVIVRNVNVVSAAQPLTGWRRTFVGAASVAQRFIESWFAPALALLGLVSITTTGGLGGLLVYGPDLDPVTKLLYGLIAGE